MQRSTLLILLAVIVIAGVALIAAQRTTSVSTDAGGTRVDAPGTRVETDSDKTRIQAPGVDITVPRDKTGD